VTAPALAREAPGTGRVYDIPGRGALPSVTNVIDVMSKPALAGWRGKVVARWAFEHAVWLAGRAGRAAALDVAGRHADADALREESIRWARRAPDRRANRAAVLGTRVHAIAEAKARGAPAPAASPEEATYVPGYDAFVASFQPRFRRVETTVVNLTHGYAGTADALAALPALNDALAVVDWKTSRTAVWPEVALQLAALANAEFIIAADGTLTPMPSVVAGLAVRLHPTLDRGYAVWRADIGPQTFQAFLGLLAAWPFYRNGERTLAGPIQSPEELIA